VPVVHGIEGPAEDPDTRHRAPILRTRHPDVGAARRACG
jgi:hypothetical protein